MWFNILKYAKLESMVKYIGDKLQICGVVNMEFINHNDDFYLIDINPRFSAGIAFSCKSGYDFINAHLACFMGHSIKCSEGFDTGIFVKHYVES